MARFDWLAMPLIPYLYAVNRVEDIPDISDAAMVVRLREHYHREHLSSIVSDDRARPTPKGNWIQLIGTSYDRKLYFFQIETTLEQDEALIAELNRGTNQGRFNLFFHNCADFARDVINHYYPKVARRNFVADLGMTTPKQVAKNLVRFSRKNQELKFSAYALEQVPGNRPHSRPPCGVTESFLRTKRYALPLLALQPWLFGLTASTYVATGRFNLSSISETVLTPADLRAGRFRLDFAHAMLTSPLLQFPSPTLTSGRDNSARRK